jgi:hypothetical protein
MGLSMGQSIGIGFENVLRESQELDSFLDRCFGKQ